MSRYATYSVRNKPENYVKKSSKKSLTQAFSRHIIGVASEYKNYPEAQNKKETKNSTIKQPFLAGGCFFVSIFCLNQRQNPTFRSGSIVGGAGGYCPRVQSATYYPSTSIVPFRFLSYGHTRNGTKTCVARTAVMIREPGLQFPVSPNLLI